LANALEDKKTTIRQMKMTHSHPEYESLKKCCEAKRQAIGVEKVALAGGVLWG